MNDSSPRLDGIAIIGMAGRFPGAQNVGEFWRNQLDGIESISHFRVEDLEVPNAAELAANPNYVRARSVLEDVDLFDAEFFGILPREAALMDPQQRLFLESCWQCFEDCRIRSVNLWRICWRLCRRRHVYLLLVAGMCGAELY
jgi:acyl transferase domain-containing protein